MSDKSAAASPEETIADLSRRLAVVEDIEAIKQITYKYCTAADKYDGRPGDYGANVADCFTSDGAWDGGVLGRFEDRKGLTGFWDSEFQTRMTQMASHMAMNPIIAVNGDDATGDFHLLAQLTFNGEALWTAGRYHNSYRRTADGWRIKEMKYDPWMWSRHLEGWARERFLEGTSSLKGD
ncbi:nuclear transport factor 2 family protein (plasmid) [Sphingomonas paeninsulae]|uniref:Nuclear transport factor 2 family protein n=1 Tax=Sphingomonas paeninsulae TaxID=2319844 RepID=A0A494TGH4_SPHPE|nr:nuclear transport factor 2 family protein [Sphingomonas paeninsulae]AYJ84921.1 nuclear transport factor 2 family protein [Sphingomonas paeninsulae]